METAICINCLDDEHLRKFVKIEGDIAECFVCHGDEATAFTVEQLCAALDPIIRTNFGQDEDGRLLAHHFQIG